MSIQLSPDVEAGLRGETASLGMDVKTLIASAVQAYLRGPATEVGATQVSL